MRRELIKAWGYGGKISGCRSLQTGVAALFLRNGPFPYVPGVKFLILQSEGLNDEKIIEKSRKN